MRTYLKIILLDDDGNKFFGEGPYRLLRLVEETGSLRSAAMSMNMAYTKALKMLKRAEEVLGYPLTHRITGGASGGGSHLTKQGKEWLETYESYRNACISAEQKLFDDFFPQQ
ncbi:MAG: LysR family transcriptional regulator [Oscillospiraceae bacterium]|nr:LysR family transcriptional regulator [Oscillospiraceae bacterium]